MSNKLLIIDPQNDFMDQPNAALPVPGALADMARLSKLLDSDVMKFSEVIVTLDSHAGYGVERTTFWQDENGKEVAPFTLVTAQDVKSGRITPKDISQVINVLEMLSRLQEKRPGPMVIWPVHCVTGTWGHNVESTLAGALARWELKNFKSVRYVVKGQSPDTEHFSAIAADVVMNNDPRTQPNLDLLNALGNGKDTVFVAGQAASHCVAFTVEDFWGTLPFDKRNCVALLTDCMSPVPGFEDQAERFFAKAKRYNCFISKAQNILTTAFGVSQ